MYPVARPLPGAGILARSGELLLLCADGGAGVDALLAAFYEVSAAGGDGAALVRRVAALLATDDAGRLPSCATYGPTTEGRGAVLVHGTAVADIAAADGRVALSGADAVTSMNRIIAGPVGSVRLALPGAAEPDPRVRLGEGVVTAAGVYLSIHSGYSTVEPYELAPASLPAESLPRRPGTLTPDPLPPAASSYIPAQPAPPDGPAGNEVTVAQTAYAEPLFPDGGAAAQGTERVLGVFCANGHFIDPSQPACPVCGSSMAARTAVVQEGPRPSLGVLLLDDGAVVDLDMDVVLGREPQFDPGVVDGMARPVKIADTDGVVSRRHARINLLGWDVQLTDLSSANGTYIQPAGAPERQQLAPQTPTIIHPGTVITLGRRTVVFEPRR